MSKYKRDDKTFRAQIAKLADAGLTFPTAPTNFNGVPAYVTVHEPQYEIAPKGKLPEFVAGLIAGVIIVAGGWLAFKALVLIWSVIL